MKLQENTIVELRVARLAEWGAFLDAETGKTSDDVLLHKEQQTEPVAVDDRVQVFLYHDPKGRLTASMRLPRIRPGQIAYAPVENTRDFGAFVDLGTERGIFLPFAEMRGHVRVGERIWVKLYEDKSGRLALTMDVDEEMNRLAKPAEDLARGAKVQAAIYNITADGALGITPQRYIVFIHRSEWTRPLKVGEQVEARVTYVREEDGRLNASLRPQKEHAIGADAEAILSFLTERGGSMPYTDATDATVIRQRFGISKSAFKRALGHLLKEKRIEQRDGMTLLLPKE